MEKTYNMINVINSAIRGKEDREITTWIKGTTNMDEEEIEICISLDAMREMGLIDDLSCNRIKSKIYSATIQKVTSDLKTRMMIFSKQELIEALMCSEGSEALESMIKAKQNNEAV